MPAPQSLALRELAGTVEGRSFAARNETKGTWLCMRGRLASGFWGKALGLMFRREWREMDALLLTGCSSIHTCCMRMPIDVCFLDDDLRVVKVVSRIGPWRLALTGGAGCHTLELPAGTLARTGTDAGDHIMTGVSPGRAGPGPACRG
ncbi:MAG: DUF192 domain-containing protein [bacterium]